MKNKTKEELIIEWKQIRGNFFNLLKEDKKEFEKAYKDHPFYESVLRNFDKSFRDINQIAQQEVNLFMAIENKERI